MAAHFLSGVVWCPIQMNRVIALKPSKLRPLLPGQTNRFAGTHKKLDQTKYAKYNINLEECLYILA